MDYYTAAHGLHQKPGALNIEQTRNTTSLACQENGEHPKELLDWQGLHQARWYWLSQEDPLQG